MLIETYDIRYAYVIMLIETQSCIFVTATFFLVSNATLMIDKETVFCKSYGQDFKSLN